MKPAPRLLPALVMAFACLCAAGALTGCTRRAQAPLRIAVNPWPGYEYIVLARDRGYFAAEGVDVQLVELESPGDSRTAFENGLVDINAATLVELLVSRVQSDKRPQAFYVLDFSSGSDMLIADSSIVTVADLRGKRIAVESASVDLLALALALRSANMTLADVDLSVMPQSDKRSAMRDGAVNAAQCFPPVSAEIAALRGSHRIFDSSQVPGMIVDVLIADSARVAQDPRRFAAIVRAIDRAQVWAKANEDEAVAAMAAREHLSPAEFHAALDGIRLVPLAAQRTHLAPNGSAVLAIGIAERALTLSGTIRPIPDCSHLVTTAALPGEGVR